MAKPKADEWLRSSFAYGVPELALAARKRPGPPYTGAFGRCWLSQHDEKKLPCSGRLERFHFLRRQTVEDGVWRHLFGALDEDYALVDPAEAILLAAWDPRNAEIGCEGHHRRFDNHIGPALVVPRSALPARTVEFAAYWDLQHFFDDRFA